MNNWLWWEDRRRELHFLEAGRARGLFLAQLGSQVGVGKQGVLDRIDRLQALLRFDRPDEKLSRAARRAAMVAQRNRCVESAWVDARKSRVVSVIGGIVAEADRFELDDAGREWIDELAVDAGDDRVGSATMVILGLAVAELRSCAEVLALDAPDGGPQRRRSGVRHDDRTRVHAVLAAADALRSEFASLGAATR